MSNWDKRIERAEKYLEPAMVHGRKVYARYQDKRDGTIAGDLFLKKINLFYANISTLKESLFNSLPLPEVSRLQKDSYNDDASRVAALILQRALNYEVQCSKGFTDSIKSSIVDWLVPGIGQVWVKFDVDADPEQKGGTISGSESISIETVYWEDFLYEPTRTWEQVTWVGRRLEMGKHDIIARWGEEALTDIPKTKNMENVTPKEVNEGKYEVYEIWDKTTRKVYHVVKGKEEPLDAVDDPYHLKDFFPCPKPLIANVTTTAFLPVTNYHIAQDQYNQLDILYARISKIIEAIKVAGIYDSASTELGRMLQGHENMMIPVDNWAMHKERGGTSGMIEWFPIDQVAQVLQLLQAEFEAVKELLKEVTGLSDIVRGGDSNQYETAQAQQMKAQFASVRMNGDQRLVHEFVRDILRIIADMMMQLYTNEKVLSIVGQLNEYDKPLIPAAAEILRSDQLRMYRVDIQSDSLVQADWAFEKQSKMELIGYISQFIQSSAAATQTSPELAPLFMGLLKFSISGFKGASEVEGLVDEQLDSMLKAQQEAQKNPQPPQPSEEDKAIQASIQIEQQKAQAAMEIEQQKMQAELARMKMQADLNEQTAQNDMVLKQQQSQVQTQIEREQAALDMEVERNKAELSAQLADQKMQHDAAMFNLEFEHKQRLLELETQVQAVQSSIKIDHQHTMNSISQEKK